MLISCKPLTILLHHDGFVGEGQTSLKKFMGQLENRDVIWTKIKDVIIKTMLSIQSDLVQGSKDLVLPDQCFNLLAFNLRIDSNEKPWLLKVDPKPYRGLLDSEDEELSDKILADFLQMINLDT